MKIKLGFVLFLLLLAVPSLSAQTNQPIKVFAFEDFGCEELKLVTHNFIVEIVNNPGSRGYVVGYVGKFRRFNQSPSNQNFRYAFPRRNELKSRLDLIRKQLVFLGPSSTNFVFINGGIREHLTIEYFVVPKGVSPPKPTPTLTRIKHVNGVAKRMSLGDC